MTEAASRPDPVPPRKARPGSFRTWPAWLVFAPVAGRVLLRGAMHGDLSLPLVANPLPGRDASAISVSKSSVLASLGPEARDWFAPAVVVRNAGTPTVAAALEQMRAAGLAFPLVAKPDRGTGGKGVRRLAGEADLHAYAAAFPPGESFLLQQLVDLPNEAGIMYVRHPAEDTGEVVAMAFKEAATVTGDGRSTLRALIETHPHAPLLRRQARAEHAGRLDTTPAPGERIELVFARNRSGGALCLDACDQITPELIRRIDAIARDIPGFHIGRFDVRFDMPERLRAGEDLRILEVNCGISEPLHAWDPASGVLDVWRAYFRQIDLIYRIGAENRALGHVSPGTLGFLRILWRQRRQMSAFAGKR